MKLRSCCPTLLCFTAVILFSSCSGSWSKEEENFVQTYTEVLIAREQHLNDTAKANATVRTIIKQRGFTEAAFRQRFNEFASKPEKLRQMLDSARNRARRIGEEEAEKERKEKEKEQKEKEQKEADKARQDSAAKPVTPDIRKEIR